MFTFNDITQLIVGSAAARRSEIRRLERKYKDAEANLKLVTEVTRASTRAPSTSAWPSFVCHVESSLTTGSESLTITTAHSPVIREDMGMAVARTPGLHRTLSTPAVASFPPNLLNDFKRTNSESQVANPLPELTGFGAYRRGAHASISWQLNHLEEKFKNDGDIIAQFLGDHPPLGTDAKVWQEYCKRNAHKHKSRQASVHTFRSSRSPSSAASSAPKVDACSEYTDPKTGTKVYRGFSTSQSITISNSSSPAGSGRKGLTIIPEKIKKAEPTRVIDKARLRGEMRKAMFECAIDSDESDDTDESDWEDEE